MRLLGPSNDCHARPTMTEPNKWTVKRFADVGTAEPFVARLSIGLLDILDATQFPNRDEIKESIIELTLESIMPAFLSLRELRKIVDDDKVPILTKQKNYEDMYKSLWTAYKDRMKITVNLMGYELGFLFQKDSLFDDGCGQFEKSHPEVSEELIIRMRRNRAEWHLALRRFRNDYLEHKKIKREDVEEFYSLAHAERTFYRVWVAIEETLAILLVTQLSVNFCYTDIPETERDPQLPLRFRLGLVKPG
jgi:hypothetical protein